MNKMDENIIYYQNKKNRCAYDVSVIIPIYNKEDYLERCLSSLIGQTYDNFEIICIDDASTDHSYNVMLKCLQDFKRTKVIRNKENLGAAYSRNKGISIAEGEYLLILDADDRYDVRLIQSAVMKCKEKKLDVLLYDYFICNDSNKCQYREAIPYVLRNILVKDEIVIQEKKADFCFQISLAAPWCKMYKRDFILNNGLEFQDLPNSNDAFWGRLSLVLAGKVGYINNALVTYYKDNKGHISGDMRRGAINFTLACEKLYKGMKSRQIYEIYKRSFLSYALKVTCGHLEKSGEWGFQEQLNSVKKRLRLIIGTGTKEDFICEFYYELYIRFLQIKTYEEFIKECTNEYQLAMHTEKMLQLRTYAINFNGTVVLWGNGSNGKKIKKAFELCGINHVIVDMNEGVDFSPDNNVSEFNFIVVSSSSILQSVLEYTRKNNIKGFIFDIEAYICYGVDFSNCIMASSR